MRAKAIDADAAEVAFYTHFRATPTIVKVERHTPTQVRVAGKAFSRATGEAHGYSSAYIRDVTQEVHDQIAAATLRPEATAVWDRVWKLQEAKHSNEREALRKLAQGRASDDIGEVREAIASMRRFAKYAFGIDIEPEKKA